MPTMYILESLKNGRHYIGSTSDVTKRLSAHNSGANRSTRPYRPWRIVYTEEFTTKAEALKREMQVKSYKGGRAFKKLLS